MPTKTKTLNLLQNLLKAFVLGLLIIFIWLKLYEQSSSIEEVGATLRKSFFEGDGILLLSIILLLVPANWLLEAAKWRLVSSPIEQLSLGSALRGVLTGLALGFITPHAWGDYAGRIWHMEKAERKYALASVLMARASQMAVTLLFGLPGLFYLLRVEVLGTYYPPALFTLLIVSMAVGIPCALLFANSLVQKLKSRFSSFSWFAYILPLQHISTTITFKLLGLSFIRYLCFSFQFLLMLKLFGIDLPLSTQAMGIGFVYLAKSIIPAFNFLSDLGVREFSALLFFEHTGAAAGLMVSASLAIWIFNILIPTIPGAFYIFRMKILAPKP